MDSGSETSKLSVLQLGRQINCHTARTDKRSPVLWWSIPGRHWCRSCRVWPWGGVEKFGCNATTSAARKTHERKPSNGNSDIWFHKQEFTRILIWILYLHGRVRLDRQYHCHSYFLRWDQHYSTGWYCCACWNQRACTWHQGHKKPSRRHTNVAEGLQFRDFFITRAVSGLLWETGDDYSASEACWMDGLPGGSLTTSWRRQIQLPKRWYLLRTGQG